MSLAVSPFLAVGAEAADFKLLPKRGARLQADQCDRRRHPAHSVMAWNMSLSERVALRLPERQLYFKARTDVRRKRFLSHSEISQNRDFDHDSRPRQGLPIADDRTCFGG